MFSDLVDLDDAHRYVAGMDVRYDPGDDHRLVGALCPDMKVTLERPDPDGSPPSPPARAGWTSTPPRWCVRRAHGSANRPEHRINSRLRFAQ
ncbi:hypothetical protein ACWC4E_12600 [Streptomyces sp. NPDC001273]|uniref:hypothetical protein n=1 Tax=unclassified Streptomyces TaxID=2593676 RepID=UPI0033F8F480